MHISVQMCKHIYINFNLHINMQNNSLHLHLRKQYRVYSRVLFDVQIKQSHGPLSMSHEKGYTSDLTQQIRLSQ